MQENYLFLYCFVPPYNSLSRYIKKFSIIIPHMTKQVNLRRHVYALVQQMSKVHLVKHFQVKNIPCATVYWITKCFEDGLPYENKTRKGCSNKLNKQ